MSHIAVAARAPGAERKLAAHGQATLVSGLAGAVVSAKRSFPGLGKFCGGHRGQSAR